MDQLSQLSRRTFLKGAGLAGATTLFGAGLAGCAAPASSANTQTSTAANATSTALNPDGIGIVVDPASTEEADVVVVGSGIGGFFSAMIAQEQAPDAKVIMLEKNSFLGGSTNFAECNGPATNMTDAEARLEGYNAALGTGFISNSILHYERLKERGDNADWLFGKHKVGWYKAGPAFYEGGNGSSAIKTLTPLAEGEGVDIRKSARATALLVDDEYKVTGIQYVDEGNNVVHVNAKAVILATGGMSTNKDILAQYSSQDMEKIIGWGEGQDGDGHLMAEQTAHGRANHLCVASLFNNVGDGVSSCAYDSPLGVSAAMQFSNCFVNEYGMRFADESGGGKMGTAESGKLIESQGYVFSIMDASMIEKYEAGGCTRHYSGFADRCVEKPIDLQAELATYAGESFIYKADTLKALGEAIKADVSYFDVNAFTSEIENYSSYAASGTDLAYGKGAENLWAIDEGPYYAFQISSGMLNTCGGIRINRDAQATDARGNVIEGLYASGVCTSGWDGEVYGGGTCQTVGMWAGSKAARHVVENVLGGTVAKDWMGTESSMDSTPVAAPKE